jgi:DNA-binding response OmpR family regulator
MLHAPPAAGPPGVHNAPSLLVIDDDEPLAFGLAKLLERQGFKVRVANHGRRGFQILRQNPVDLVITDIYMAEMEGLETIMQLRRERPRLPVIAMSGGSRRVGVDCLAMAKGLGAAEVLEKPVTIADLLAAIRKLGIIPPH